MLWCNVVSESNNMTSNYYTSQINIIIVFPSISLIFHDKADTGRGTV